MSFDMHDKTISVSDLTDFLDANPDPDEDEKDSSRDRVRRADRLSPGAPRSDASADR